MPSGDEKFMRLALRLAERGRGNVSPNPMVGCVVVRGGKIVGRGWHKAFGGPHAEVFALGDAGKKARGATLFVNLEPCSHFGKTPPCADAIIASGVSRVVCAMRDPHKAAAGGLEKLRRAGLETKCGVLEKEALQLNECFITLASTGLPFVVLKAAVSSDGFIAAAKGAVAPRWISCAASRLRVHKLRAECDAILVGAGTVLADDPRLTARLAGRENVRQPLRVILDPRLRSPLSAKVFAGPNVLVAVSKNCDLPKRQALEKKGVRFMACKTDSGGGVDLRFLLAGLGKRGVSSVLVEGGHGVFSSFLEEGLVGKFLLFVSPKVLGAGVPFATKPALARLGRAKELVRIKSGTDWLFEGYLG
ncbi:MAG: bifunctional diaminohydroxyphosphoribosylaminopyrimidine deaminase/5-amino-6-(5-phosphoribosylamino)uracil reductase RibD [Candidatus Micrarchaeia archaeon]